MPIHQVAILALVQGVTEFLPISSSGHLFLSSWLLGWQDQGLTFDIALHFGTLLAVLLYFFRDIAAATGYGFGVRVVEDPDLRDNPTLIWKIALATIPIGIIGFLFEHAAESVLRNAWVIGTMLIVVGLLMGWAEAAGRRVKDIAHVSWLDSIIIGVSQALSVVPGTSRSGITITAAMFRNLDRSAAARFSFLLSFPAVGGAALLGFHKLYKAGGIPPGERTAFALGVTLSAITGCLAISFLLRYLRRATLRIFVVYRVAFGILVIALAFFRRNGG
jgi:undecaprenyl-diphosphatase